MGRSKKKATRTDANEDDSDMSCGQCEATPDNHLDPAVKQEILRAAAEEPIRPRAAATTTGANKRKQRGTASDSDSDLDTVPRQQQKPRKGKISGSNPQNAPKDATTRSNTAAVNVEEVKAAASCMYSKLIEYTHDEANAINSSSRKYLLEAFHSITALLDKTLRSNAFLEGQLVALKSAVRAPVPATAPTATRALVPAPPTSASIPPAGIMSYAATAAKSSRIAAVVNAKKDQPQIVTVIPEKATTVKNSDEIKKALYSAVCPKTSELRVQSVRSMRGNGVVIEAAKGCDIISILEKSGLKKAGYVVAAAKKRNPRVILYDAPRLETDTETIDAIAKQNFPDPKESAIIKEQTKVSFRAGPKDKRTCKLILETSRAARDLISKRNCLFIGWDSCRVDDYIAATRCYKCHSFGHTAKHCRTEKEVCGHCSTVGHNFKTCPNKSNPPVCSNCRKSGKEHYHLVTSPECPCYQSALDQAAIRTDYA